MDTPRMTLGDWAWLLLFFALFLPLLVGGLELCVVHVVPAVLGVPYDTPMHGVQKLIGTAFVVVAVGLAGFVTILCFSVLARLFMSAETYGRWVLLSEAGRADTPPWIQAFGVFFLRCIRRNRGVSAP
jgi:hypothetical protein